MPRKDRADILIGNLEKKLGLAKGAIRNPDGTDARSDKKLGTLREEYRSLYGSMPVRKNASIIAAATQPKAIAKKRVVKPTAKAAATAVPKKSVNTPKKAATATGSAKKSTAQKATASAASKKAGTATNRKK